MITVYDKVYQTTDEDGNVETKSEGLYAYFSKRPLAGKMFNGRVAVSLADAQVKDQKYLEALERKWQIKNQELEELILAEREANPDKDEQLILTEMHEKHQKIVRRMEHLRYKAKMFTDRQNNDTKRIEYKYRKFRVLNSKAVKYVKETGEQLSPDIDMEAYKKSHDLKKVTFVTTYECRVD